MVTQCNCGLGPRPLTAIPVYFPLLIWWHTPLVPHSTLSWTHCISVAAEIHISLDDPQDNCVLHQAMSFICLLSPTRPFLMPRKPTQPMCKHSPEAALRNSPPPKGKWEGLAKYLWSVLWEDTSERYDSQEVPENQVLVSYNSLGNNPLYWIFLHL